MRKLRELPLLTQFGLMIVLLLIISAAALWRISGQLSETTFTESDQAELVRATETAEEWAERLENGMADRDAVQQWVNPELNPGQVFMMLLDPQKQVIAFSDNGVAYFGRERVQRLVRRLEREGQFSLTERDTGTWALVVGKKTRAGYYILAGKPTREYRNSLTNYRNRLVVWMIPSLLLFSGLLLVLSQVSAGPLRKLKRAAQAVEHGELVHLDTDMPGEAGAVALAFNQMSKQVSATITALERESDSRRQLLEALDEGIIALDPDGELMERNSAANKLLGEGTAAWNEVMDALRQALKLRQPGRRRIRVGEDTLEAAITLLPADSGKNGVMAVIRDITEAERLERTRFEYVANISHELRTPLANMRGLSEGLRDGLVTDEQERMRYYGIIVDEVRRLSRLVNDLLELSGLQSNPAAFEMERVQPTEVMFELFDLNKQMFSDNHQALLLDVPKEDLPEIITNEDRLSEVLTIFLDNARKYTPAGGQITLGAQVVTTDGLETGIRFYVRDNGIGIDEEAQRHIFDRFHQADKSHASKGSGLGLSIAREILLKMNVEIALKSELGKGSEFSFILPVP